MCTTVCAYLPDTAEVTPALNAGSGWGVDEG